jgi:hypothetical protein
MAAGCFWKCDAIDSVYFFGILLTAVSKTLFATPKIVAICDVHFCANREFLHVNATHSVRRC